MFTNEALETPPPAAIRQNIWLVRTVLESDKQHVGVQTCSYESQISRTLIYYRKKLIYVIGMWELEVARDNKFDAFINAISFFRSLAIKR